MLLFTEVLLKNDENSENIINKLDINVQMTQEPQKRLLSLSKSLVKKKLEDKILDIIDMPVGTSDKNLFDYIRIAQKHNFSNEELLLKDLALETFEKLLEQSSNPKKKRAQPEKELEDYLSKGNNLERIEEGLTYLSRQYCIKSGILDIKAEDIESKPVSIELKFDDYSTEKVTDQLKGYLNERKGERVLFVAPEVRPIIFYRLKEFYDEGRLLFFHVKKNGEDYDFEKVNESNLPEARHLNLDVSPKQKKDDSDSDTITLFKPKRQKKKRKHKKNEAKKESDIDWVGSSLQYKVLILGRPDLRNNEKYREPILIDAEKMSSLQELEETSKLEEFITVSEKEKYFMMKREGIDKIQLTKKERKDILDGLESFNDKYDTYFDTISSKFIDTINLPVGPTTYAEALGTFKNIEEELNNLITEIKYDDKGLKKLRAALNSAMKKHPNTNKEYCKQFLWTSSYKPPKKMLELIQLKILRTELLKEVDEEIALSYLLFGPAKFTDIIDDGLNGKLGEIDTKKLVAIHHAQVEKNKKELVKESQFGFPTFWKKDQELYESILSNLFVKDKSGDLETHTLYYKVLVLNRPNLKDRSKYLARISLDEKQYGILTELNDKATLKMQSIFNACLTDK